MLYIISTPIGNLEDISRRAINTLCNVDYIVCEDTRTSKKLLNKYNISNKLVSYGKEQENKKLSYIIKLLSEQHSIALISDAGTPLISDPGFRVVQACQELNIPYTHIPGACSVISAMILSGFPAEPFIYLGFLNKKTSMRQKQLSQYLNVHSSLVIFESPNRILATLEDIKFIFSSNIKVAIIKEITKMYETVNIDNVSNLIDKYSKHNPRGEHIIIINNNTSNNIQEYSEINKLINILKENEKLTNKDISYIVSKYHNVPRKEVYSIILK